MKPFGVQFKEGQVDASLTLHKVKTIYSICQLRVSIIFDSALAITNSENQNGRSKMAGQSIENFFCELSIVIDCRYQWICNLR